MVDQKYNSWDEFQKECPLLCIAVMSISFISDTESDWEFGLSLVNAACTTYSPDAAEQELLACSTAQYAQVVRADPGEMLEFAPRACEFLTSVFE